MKVNIPRTIADPKYRYQMPCLIQKIEGRGINIRTNLSNLKEVAKSLRVPAVYILKYMEYEFGSKINVKDNVTSINGELNEGDVLKQLDKFIDKYILCGKCKLPEPVLQVDAQNELISKCNSCGAITHMDKKHKLTTFIIKNPPENQSEIKTQRADITVVNETKTKTTSEDFKFLRMELKDALRQSEFSPLEPESRELFENFTEYLQKVLPIDTKYEFDDSHIEVVYKAIKRVRMEKELYDRVGHVLFNYVFGNNMVENFESKVTLFEGVLIRHRMADFVEHETLLNLQLYLYDKNKTVDMKRQIPTLMKKFHDLKIFTEVGLIEIPEVVEEQGAEHVL